MTGLTETWRVNAHLRGSAKLKLVVQDAATGAEISDYSIAAKWDCFHWSPDTFSFKLMDAEGRVVPRADPAPPEGAGPAPAPARLPDLDQVTAMLRTIEEVQRKEVTAIKGIVVLLFEKGVFTREEYLAKVKR